MKKLFVLLIPLFLQCSYYGRCAFSTYEIPYSIFFLVNKDGKRISELELTNCNLYYYSKSIKKSVKDLIRATDEFYDLGILTSRDIGFISGEDNIKEFYLEYGNGDIDTLYVDYKSLNQEDACNHPCKCCCPLELVKFNGQIATIDSTIKVQQVYIFNKK